jgi:hypothetical protein
MAEGLRAAQGVCAEGFSVSIKRAGVDFEYGISGRTARISGKDVAEILFSVALDIQAREAKGDRLENLGCCQGVAVRIGADVTRGCSGTGNLRGFQGGGGG